MRSAVLSSHEVGLATKPLARFDATICPSGTAAIVEIPDTVVTVSGVKTETLRNLLDMCDGKRDLAYLAENLGLRNADVRNLVSQLSDAGVLVVAHLSDDDLIDPSELIDACRTLFPVLKQRLFSHSLWRSLTGGTASQDQFAGWLLESYHFIEGVTIRMPLVIASCREHNIRRHFVEHFSEEYDHHHFFMRSLNALGISAEQVHASPPLPGTGAVLNWMRNCARQDALQYAACSGFLESTGADHQRARSFFSVLAKKYDSAGKGIVSPMADHVDLDEQYEHSGFIEKICAELPRLSLRRADAALQAAVGLVETLELWSTDIERHYRNARVSDGGVRHYRVAGKLDFANAE